MTSVRVEPVERCPLCRGGQFSPLFLANDYDSGTGRYTVAQCLDCSMQFTTPRPIPADLPLLYADRTFDALPSNRSAAAHLRRWRAEARIRSLWPRVPSGPLRVAEVGVGDGFFASILSSAPRVFSVFAADIFESAPPLLRGNSRVTYAHQDSLFASGAQFEVIFARFVLEHVADPVAFIDALDAHLRPGGLLVVEVPNASSLWRRIFGAAFAELSVPAHLLHFTPKTLARLLERFDVEIQEDLHGLTLARSLGNLLGLRTARSGLLSLMAGGLEVTVDRLLGPPANMTALALKRVPPSSIRPE